jgi:RNA polymerase sigma-70 factor (ECF subfamily)
MQDQQPSKLADQRNVRTVQEGPKPSPLAALSDAELVCNIQENSLFQESAFEELLVVRRERWLRSLFKAWTYSPDAAADLVQALYLKLWQTRLSEFNTARQFGSWLYAVAYNLFVDHYRQLRNDHHPPSPQSMPLDEAMHNELEQQVEAILSKLGEEKQTIIRAYMQGESKADVAQRLGLTVAEVYRSAHETRRFIADELRTLGLVDEDWNP